MIDISTALGRRVTFIAGNRKNAGKTTFLNCALEQLRAKDPVAYLTVGVDGEKQDLIFGQAKPQVLARPGDTLLTAQAALARTDGLYEIHHVFPYKTVLGRLVLAVMRRDGFVELVGPETNRQVTTVLQYIQKQEGIHTILVDGAVNRLTQIATIPDAGYVYVAWAGRRNLEQTISEMKRLFTLDAVPQREGPCPENCFWVHGALTERKLRDLPETCDEILVQDFTKVFLSHRQIARLQERCRLFFRDRLPLWFFVVNLFDLDRETFLHHAGDQQLRKRIVFNPYEN
jgi:hypothetical protein